MSAKKYNYDFPENKRYLPLLKKYRVSYISTLTGYTITYLHYILNGKRKMPEDLKMLLNLLEGMATAIETYSEKELKAKNNK